PGATEAQVMLLGLMRLSLTTTLFNVTLPSLVAVTVYSSTLSRAIGLGASLSTLASVSAGFWSIRVVTGGVVCGGVWSETAVPVFTTWPLSTSVWVTV